MVVSSTKMILERLEFLSSLREDLLNANLGGRSGAHRAKMMVVELV
jgi:hypothetical protein